MPGSFIDDEYVSILPQHCWSLPDTIAILPLSRVTPVTTLSVRCMSLQCTDPNRLCRHKTKCADSNEVCHQISTSTAQVDRCSDSQDSMIWVCYHVLPTLRMSPSGPK